MTHGYNRLWLLPNNDRSLFKPFGPGFKSLTAHHIFFHVNHRLASHAGLFLCPIHQWTMDFGESFGVFS